MKRHSLKAKLVAAVVLINMIVVSLLTFLDYRSYSDLLISQTSMQTQQLIAQVASNVDSYIDELYRLTLTPYYNDTVLSALAATADTQETTLETKRVVEGFLTSVMSLPRNEVLRVYIMNEGGIYSHTRTPYEMKDYDRYLESDWYRSALQTTKPIFIQPQLERVYGEKKTPIFSLVRILRSKVDNDRTLGVIKVDADFTGIRKICDKADVGDGGLLLAINNQNELLYRSKGADEALSSLRADRLLALLEDTQHEDFVINRCDIPSCGITLVAIHAYGTITQPLKLHLIKTLAVALLCILGAAFLFALAIDLLLKPLSKIIALMKVVGTGNLNVSAEVRSHDEIGFLAESFNSMTGELSRSLEKNVQLTKEVYEAKYLEKEAQYNALSGQIKPHFLYNTLNTISLLVKCKESEKAVLAIECFSKYLGGIMNTAREISIRQELEVCEAYLQVVELRYQDRLRYSISVDEGLYPQQVPALTLQPLIENAVKYACESQRKSTHISVSGTREGAYYTLCVADNGPGISEEKLARIRAAMADNGLEPLEAEKGLLGNIGLVNISKRLRLKFGAEAAFSIVSSADGTCVSMKLPFREEEEN